MPVDVTPFANVRTLVVAEDRWVREGLSARLGALVVGESTPLDDIGDTVARTDGNVVLWDLGATGSIDAELGARLEAIDVPVVALAPGSFARGWVPGLAGLLARDTPADALRLALATALHGLFVLDPAFVPEPVAITESGAAVNDGEPLTAREQEVVQLMAEGLSNKQIADRLGISTHTAKFHVNAVLGKLGASTRTEAVVRAVQRGLLLL